MTISITHTFVSAQTNSSNPDIVSKNAWNDTHTIEWPLPPLQITETAGSSAIAITGATQTASFPVLNATQTWNNVAATFTGLKLNVTDTTSAVGSLLMDLQVGGASKFSVRKFGNVRTITGATTSLAMEIGSDSYGFYRGATQGGQSVNVVCAGVDVFAVGQNSGIGVVNTGPYSWATSIASSADLFLTRAAAASLRLGATDAASPVAQTLGVQSVVAGTTNTAGANFTIKGSASTGNAAGGSIIFQVAPAGASGTAQNTLANAFLVSAPGDSRVINSVGGSAVMAIASTSNTNVATQYKYSTAADASGGSTEGYVGRISGSFGIFDGGATMIVGKPSGSPDSISIYGTDVRLARDAANTLALRNSTNAQTFRVYGTYTDASNYERGAVQMGADYVELAAESAGTGDANMDVRLTPKGTGDVRFGTHSAIGAETVTGYITVKDAAGNTRKLAVVS